MTLPQGLDENQEFVFNLGEGNVQPGMSLSEGERIRKLEKEIKEVQNLKTIMFNQLEMKTRKWAEVDKVKQRFEDMFAGFDNKLANIEAKMEEVREKSKASERIEKKPRESGKSKVSGRIEKKSKEKPNKTQKIAYVCRLNTDLARVSLCRLYIVKRKTRRRSHSYFVLFTQLYLTSCNFYRLTLSIYISHAST